MSDQRLILEMGMGVDVHGRDYMKAARRAISDALRHSSLPLLDAEGIDHRDMRVVATIGVQSPDALDTAALAEELPRGRAEVRAVFGGLDSTDPATGEVVVIAQAAVEAFLPKRG
ncbi:Lin0512 family protein [Roseivivax sediminis]|uniref:Uncharacterized protein n=1 Tax=Roseivivax sediminis TaxID=936889 RepID=A0A1I1TZJ5_9RHOB|nr:Lin0512 family protein [Roseivivax sediminis]SFD64056.1 conserved hypothetical protein [Roseivivax sediminis]